MTERPYSTPDSGISKAVTTPDKGRVPRGVTAPPASVEARRRRHIGLTELAVGAGVVATAATAAAVGANFLANQQGRVPDQTPLPGGIVEPSLTPVPTPFSTESPTITLPPSPSPEVTPASSHSPTSWKEIVPTTTAEIQKVKVYGGNIEEIPWNDFPYQELAMQNPTIIALQPDAKDEILWVGAAVEGNKLQIESTKQIINVTINGNRLQNDNIYTGATFWFAVTDHFGLYSRVGGHFNYIGQGQEVISQHLKVGDSIPQIGLAMNQLVGFEGQSNVEKNYQTFQKFIASVGQTIPRVEKDFAFYAGAFVVEP